VNSFHEAKLIKKVPGRTKKTKVIWNGFNVDEISYGRNELNISKGIQHILIVGRQVYAKNGLNLLKALSIFESRNGWLPKITWIGRRDIDKRSAKDFRSIEMQNNMDLFLENNEAIKKKWCWIPSVDDIYDYYNKSDVLVLPSFYEGLPLVLCEAMLSGCFVIASSVCDHPVIIGDNERGLLCDPTSPESICFSLEELNKMDLKKRTSIVSNARDYAHKNFNFEEMLRKYEDLFPRT
jgi:glycosyltransferase involved in cell wall biosynthesis